MSPYHPPARARRHNRPGMCGQCHADLGHPEAQCPVCFRAFAHVSGVYSHLKVHGILPRSRAHALAMDFARALVRGWPTEAPLAKFEAARSKPS
jgi:predicted amidophosphoribosyltransferase